MSKAQLAELEARMMQDRASMERLKMQSDYRQQHQENEVQQLRQKVQDSLTLASELKGKVAELQMELAVKSNEKEAQAKTLADQLYQAHEVVKQLKGDISVNIGMRVDLQRREKKLTEQLEEQELVRTELKHKCQQFSQIAVDTNNTMIKMQSASVTSEVECEKQRQKAQVWQQEHASMRSKMQALQASLTASSAVQHSAEQTERHMQERIDALEAEVAALEVTLDEARDRGQKYREEKVAVERAAVATVSNVQAEEEKWRERVQELEQQLTQRAAQIQELHLNLQVVWCVENELDSDSNSNPDYVCYEGGGGRCTGHFRSSSCSGTKRFRHQC